MREMYFTSKNPLLPSNTFDILSILAIILYASFHSFKVLSFRVMCTISMMLKIVNLEATFTCTHIIIGLIS